MSPQSVKALAATLPGNLRYLSTLISRKPAEFTRDWAATVDEEFSLYTLTSTVDLILNWNSLLAEQGWPFPAYLDLREEVDVAGSWPFSRWKMIRALIAGRKVLQGPLLMMIIGRQPEDREIGASRTMRYLFWRHSQRIFRSWRNHPLLSGKEPIVDAIRSTYSRALFAACLPTALGILDYIMRDYFQTDRLNVSMQALRDAFDKAGILPKHLRPGSGIWDLQREGSSSPLLFPSPEHDLRLPGVFLSSFVEFAASCYAWYKSTEHPAPDLNRHAIMHCASNYWTASNTVKLLSFLDLTLRLEKVLRIVIHGPTAYTPSPLHAGA